jgi:hypothetical protein
MLPVKKLLLLSLLLLLGTYSVLGYLLSYWTVPWVVWMVIILFAFLQASLLANFTKDLKTSIREWADSDIGHFTTISIVALSLAVVLVWFQFFQYVLMILATEVLARVELQHAGLNRSRSLGVLTGISFVGLGIGWTLSNWV